MGLTGFNKARRETAEKAKAAEAKETVDYSKFKMVELKEKLNEAKIEHPPNAKKKDLVEICKEAL